MASFQESLEALQQRIRGALQRAGRPLDSVRLIGVSKQQGLEKILEATRAGLGDFGENYVQEWRSKREKIAAQDPEIARKLRWHFIGHLQGNKVKEVVGQAAYIHSVDSLKLAKKISQAAEGGNQVQKILLEVKLGEEPSKHGFAPRMLLQELKSLAELPHLSIEGLMTLPPPSPDTGETRAYFDELKSLLDECNRLRVLKAPMKELSMGMSQDFEAAVAAGATMVRIGTALFGPRL